MRIKPAALAQSRRISLSLAIPSSYTSLLFPGIFFPHGLVFLLWIFVSAYDQIEKQSICDALHLRKKDRPILINLIKSLASYLSWSEGVTGWCRWSSWNVRSGCPAGHGSLENYVWYYNLTFKEISLLFSQLKLQKVKRTNIFLVVWDMWICDF